MKVLRKDLKHGKIVLIPETFDDLWHLYNIVKKGDAIYAMTTRIIKIEKIGARPTKGRRIPVFLGVQVEKVEYQVGTDRLRFMGIVIKAPEELSVKGSRHSISVSPGKPLMIQKEEWLNHELHRIQLASEAKSKPIIVVSIDDEACCIASLEHRGFDVKVELRIELPGKLNIEMRDAALSRCFKLVSDSLSSAWNEERGLIAIVGPGFIKEEFAKYLREHKPEVAKHVETVGTVSNGGLGGAQEALRSGILDNIARKMRIIEETKAVEKVLSRLGSMRGDVTYGLDNIEYAINSGAVDLILVADELLRGNADEKRRKLEDVIRRVEKTQGSIMIVSSEHEGGKKLLGLGGVAAILRFPIA